MGLIEVYFFVLIVSSLQKVACPVCNFDEIPPHLELHAIELGVYSDCSFGVQEHNCPKPTGTILEIKDSILLPFLLNILNDRMMPTHGSISTNLNISITLPPNNHPILPPKGNKIINPTFLITDFIDRIEY